MEDVGERHDINELAEEAEVREIAIDDEDADVEEKGTVSTLGRCIIGVVKKVEAEDSIASMAKGDGGMSTEEATVSVMRTEKTCWYWEVLRVCGRAEARMHFSQEVLPHNEAVEVALLMVVKGWWENWRKAMKRVLAKKINKEKFPASIWPFCCSGLFLSF